MPQTKSKSAPAKSRNAGQTATRSVKPSSQAAEDLKELFEEQIKDIYWAEKALTKALPKMAKNATSEELMDALNNHVVETENQIQRLEQVFEMLGKTARAKKCPAMEGLITESEEIVKDTQPGPIRDAGIISACQKVEHYEIATYGTLLAFAQLLKEDDIAALLEKTLNEEKNADQLLTKVTQTAINLETAGEEDDAETEEEE